MNNTVTKLWNKNFILYFLGFELTEIGWRLAFFALPVYILMGTSDPTLIGTILALSYIPLVFVTPIGGVMADRCDKKKSLI